MLDTDFTHDSPVSLFVLLFYICFCCLFNLLLVNFGAKIQNHYLHEQERASPHACVVILEIYPVAEKQLEANDELLCAKFV